LDESAMNDSPIRPMTAAIEDACKEIDAAVGLFLDARRTLPSLGKYESEVEALNLFYLAIRDIEGVIALARTDLVLIPAAFAVSRAAFEVAVKAAWLIDVDDPYGREVRWLAHLRAEERYCERVSQRLEDLGKDAQPYRRRGESLQSFRQAVASVLPAGYRELPGNPSFEDMLKSLGGNELYILYITTSQFTHGEHAATWLYRTGGVGTEKRLGEFIRPADWYQPLRLSWLSLVYPGRVLLRRLGGSPDMFITEVLESKIVAAIDRVASDKIQ
jgi:hypothetical protein